MNESMSLYPEPQDSRQVSLVLQKAFDNVYRMVGGVESTERQDLLWRRTMELGHLRRQSMSGEHDWVMTAALKDQEFQGFHVTFYRPFPHIRSRHGGDTVSVLDRGYDDVFCPPPRGSHMQYPIVTTGGGTTIAFPPTCFMGGTHCAPPSTDDRSRSAGQSDQPVGPNSGVGAHVEMGERSPTSGVG